MLSCLILSRACAVSDHTRDCSNAQDLVCVCVCVCVCVLVRSNHANKKRERLSPSPVFWIFFYCSMGRSALSKVCTSLGEPGIFSIKNTEHADISRKWAQLKDGLSALTSPILRVIQNYSARDSAPWGARTPYIENSHNPRGFHENLDFSSILVVLSMFGILFDGLGNVLCYFHYV